ncbi:CBS domain-containing protein [Methanoculleus sp. FWC-SCC1]|uniref:CBS domain-containing protein n=1 Tax=Methanoculleus frigidifontis TaxID=2584085 RepID=A0ABT8M9P6_9EURY|nr:CBS domain-containing protein [Methanoculleus sp. FWC-SCC1]MDN7024634.1 CBS domain-containing protein [Methanoculleus sp. FWC-SCC1]
MTLEECCREEVVVVSSETTATDMARVMESRNVDSVIIVSGENKPLGIVTDRDLAVRIVARGEDPGTVRARDIMSGDLVTFSEGTGIYQAIEQMTRRGIRRMPITGRDGRLVGIITLDDIIRLIGEEMSKIAGNIEKQSPPIPR